MLHFVKWLLLVSWTTMCVQCQQAVDSNGLLHQLFLISRKDSEYMDNLVQHFVDTSGNIDKIGYDRALKESNPSLHLKMVKIRRTYLQMETDKPDAVRFIETLWTTAGQVRRKEVGQLQESRTILGNFIGLPQTTRNYLIAMFPSLRFLDVPTKRDPQPGVHGGVLEKEKWSLRQVKSHLDRLRNINRATDFYVLKHLIDSLLNRDSSSWTLKDLRNIIDLFKEDVDRISQRLSGSATVFDPLRHLTDTDDHGDANQIIDAFLHFCHVLDIKASVDMNFVEKLLKELRADSSISLEDKFESLSTIMGVVSSQVI